MRRRIGLIMCVCVFACAGWEQRAQTPEPSVQELLSKMNDALGSLRSISYHTRREINYASEGYQNVLEGDIHFEFTGATRPLDARYQVDSPAVLEIFNGSEILRCDKKSRILTMVPAPTADEFNRASFLYNSIITLRRALPALISNDRVAKTLAGVTPDTYTLEFVIQNAVLRPLGDIMPIERHRNALYRVIVDRKTWLPIEVLQLNSENKGYIQVQFAHTIVEPPSRAEDSWQYSTYLHDYRLAIAGPPRKLLAEGAVASDWTLPALGGGKVTLSAMLEKPDVKAVLAEFWISHCGYCIAAVPKLNAIHDQFAGRGLEIAAINVQDPDDAMRLFANANNPRYGLLSHGGQVAEQYGIGGFPTVFLIDRERRIRYAGGLDDAVITKRLRAVLK